MLAIATLTGRLLLRHWPALLAWFLVGVLARFLVIQLAGFVGAFTAVGGLLILPLAVLARLVGFVAMFLVLREAMPRLGAIAPSPSEPAARRRAFVDALLGGVLPFFAVYAAWGHLRQDVAAYQARALEVRDSMRWSALLGEPVTLSDGAVDDLRLEPITIAIVVVAFAGRWAWKRYRDRMPKALSVGAVYLEAVWVFLAVALVSQALAAVTGWVETRQAMVWLDDARGWIAQWLVPVAWVGEAVEWLLGEAGGILLLPVAWLTIAGVVYGQAVAPQAPALAGERIERVRSRYAALPERVRRRARDLWGELVGRFRPIGQALLLMWRAGPALIGVYVLLYTVVLALQGFGEYGLTRIIGPQDLYGFWFVFDAALVTAVTAVVEPIRVSLVASAYDATLAALPPVSTPRRSSKSVSD
ncbi:hypothetical protein [Microbacterium sp. 18062]|uniref:hypothetical protein n=1 Tax=Microbacterium sp. 18062 TaxID=2681410 RepID=UPI00135697B8|nr:hypothetical protein [Microbacterium sp. 18062]